VSSDHRAALGLYRAYFLEPAAFFYVLVAVVTTPRRASLILAGFGLALTALAIPNIEVTLKAAQNHTLNVAGTPPVAIYTVSNAVALFEVPVIVVAAAVMLYGTTWFERAIGAFIVGLGTLSVLLTFSRGAYLALFVAAIVLALTHRLRIVLLVLVVVVIAAALRLPGVTKRIAQELNLSDPRNSLFPRFQLWGVTMRMLAHHPIFGSGLSGFASAINPYRNGYAELQIYPHNILLNFWTETGLLGLVAFGWLMVKTVIATLAGWLHGSSGWRPYQLGVLLFVVAVLAHGLVDRGEGDARLAPRSRAGGDPGVVETPGGVLDEAHAAAPFEKGANRGVVADVGRDPEDQDPVRIEPLEQPLRIGIRKHVEALLQQEELPAGEVALG